MKVRCINNNGASVTLMVGRVYEVLDTRLLNTGAYRDSVKHYRISSGLGAPNWYSSTRFEKVQEVETPEVDHKLYISNDKLYYYDSKYNVFRNLLTDATHYVVLERVFVKLNMHDLIEALTDGVPVERYTLNGWVQDNNPTWDLVYQNETIWRKVEVLDFSCKGLIKPLRKEELRNYNTVFSPSLGNLNFFTSHTVSRLLHKDSMGIYYATVEEAVEVAKGILKAIHKSDVPTLD